MIDTNYTYKARITNVVDGDTIDADIDLGFHLRAKLRLRLSRVDTPEMNSKDIAVRAKAAEAKAFVTALVLNQDVVITTQKADSFGRYLAEVYVTTDIGTQKNVSDALLGLELATLFTG